MTGVHRPVSIRAISGENDDPTILDILPAAASSDVIISPETIFRRKTIPGATRLPAPHTVGS